MEYVEIELMLPKPPSLNMIYAGKHWSYRAKKKNEYKDICKKELAKHDLFTADRIRIFIDYNSRLDIDNGILVSKFLADTLTSEGYIKDDSPKFYDKITIQFNSGVDKNFYRTKVRCWGYRFREQSV